MPKKDGGLGITPLVQMNSVLNLKHIWNILSPSNSTYWRKRIHAYMIKGHSFWHVKPPSQCSWYWRKLLKLRTLAKKLVTYKIGNGVNTFLWRDPWFPFGSLFDKYGPRVIMDAAIPSNSKVNAIIEGNEWSWPVPSSWELIEIKAASRSIPLNPQSNDTVLWASSPNGTFVTSHTWTFLRGTNNRVPWYHLVWFSGNLPRHSFTLWLAVYNKLSTQDRIWKFTLGPLACVLCNLDMDSHDHFFFTCKFSSFIWQGIMGRLNVAGCPQRWSSLIPWATHKWKSKKPNHIIPRICIGTMVYTIWRERNARIFRQESKTLDKILSSIIQTIHDLIQVKWRNDPKLQDYLAIWC